MENHAAVEGTIRTATWTHCQMMHNSIVDIMISAEIHTANSTSYVENRWLNSPQKIAERNCSRLSKTLKLQPGVGAFQAAVVNPRLPISSQREPSALHELCCCPCLNPIQKTSATMMFCSNIIHHHSILIF